MSSAIVFGVLLEDARQDWPGRNQLMIAMSRHLPIVFLEREPGARFLSFRRPTITKTADNLYRCADAFAVRSSRLGRQIPRLAALLDTRWFRTALRDAGFDDYVFWLTVNDPALAYGVPSNRLVYDCMDPNFLPAQQRRFDRNERRIARKARIVFASAQSLFTRMSSVNASTYLLPNAAPVPTPPSSTSIPALLQTMQRPIVGYLGTVDWRFDPDYLEAAARALPDAQFAIVGRVNADQEARLSVLRESPNVIFAGQVDGPAGEAYIAAFDVGLIPFTPSPMNDAINPVKMYMYLAAGLPVVSTWIAECRSNPFVSAARTPEEFAEFIQRALDAGSRDAEERRTYANSETWAHRACEAVEVLVAAEMLPAAARIDS